MDDLYYPVDFPSFADNKAWKLIIDPILDDENSLTSKFGATLRIKGKVRRETKPTSADEAAAIYDAICKYGWPGTVIKEYFCSRLMRLAGLPAAPVQFIVLPKKTSIFNFGTLIHIIPSRPANELWKMNRSEIEAYQLDPSLVVKLKAFAIWASFIPGNEIGEFRISNTNIPFLIDHQDSLWINAFGIPEIFPKNIHNDWKMFFVGNDQIDQAELFWKELSILAQQLNILDFVDNKALGITMIMIYRKHFSEMLKKRRP